ncbi:hypothetical protein LIA77_03415 [Sarocladium implicatum]|nr:hypothetical protein LIA77_03415 [Sarocladium implicatum]
MPSKTRQSKPVSTSRFQEGSMNDRASAAPPVQFLTNDENIPPATYFEDLQPQCHRNIRRKPVPYTKAPTTTIRAIRDDESEESLPPKPKEKAAAKKSSRIFGQVWDGVFGILSGKSSSNSSESSGRKKTPSMMSTASTATTGSKGATRDSKEVKLEDLRARLQQNDSGTNRPSKEDVLQSYNELVASGFFSSHAIQSTRHSRPGTAKSTFAPPPPFSAEARQTPPPQWPLSTPSKQQPQTNKQILQQHQPHVLSPIPMTPGSAGSRGRKRAADDDHDDNGYGGDDNDQSTTPRSASKKLRKSASRDVSGAGPRLRSVSSRRILSRRSFSGIASKITNAATSPPSQSSPQAVVTLRGPLLPHTSPSKLTKRPPPSTTGRPTVRAPLSVPGRSSSASYKNQGGFHTSESAPNLDARVLRPRRSALTGTEARSVVPDVDMGIPGVPAIPPEFTYGEDRVVGGPWRGLRR